MNIEDRAYVAAKAVLDDCCDRRGIKQAIAAIDDDVLDEILEAWTKVIAEVFSRPEPFEEKPR